MVNKRRTKKRIWQRWWVWLPLLLLAGVGVVAGVWGWNMYQEYDGRAAEFDLSKLEEMESASLIYDRNEVLLGRIYIRNRDTVSLEEFPAHLLEAVVAAEDNRFYQHDGIDYIGMLRAAIKNQQAGRITQGASTLTMQLARNTFALRERSYERKLVEAFLSRRIEAYASKSQIMEWYLNRVYYGAGLYGAEAAAQGYFGKSARHLTLSESAMLAGLLKSPNNLSPWKNRRAAVNERNFVLARMLELKMISQVEYEAAVAEELDVKNRKNLYSESYALDYIRQQVIAKIGYENALKEGYRIYTTIDARLQNLGKEKLREKLREVEKREGYEHQTLSDFELQYSRYEREVREGIKPEDAPPPIPTYLQGAVVMLDNKTGGVRVMIGGRDFAHSEFNRAVSAKRPAGTAFKPIVYAAAWEKGLFPGTILEDGPLDNRQVMIGGTTGILGEWGPELEENRFEGDITAKHALVQSKNSASVRLGMKTGLEDVMTMAKRAGITSTLRGYPSTYLGASEVSLMEMSLAYTMIPEAGERPAAPYVLERIVGKDGKVVFSSEVEKRRVVRDSVAYQLHSALSEALQTGTAYKARSVYRLRNFDAGGKTGTAYDFTDLWFLGYSSEITCGVWMGFDTPKTIYRGAFSSEVVLPVWTEIMNAAAEVFPPRKLEQPKSVQMIEICSSSSQLSCPECVKAARRRDSESFVAQVLADSVQNRGEVCWFHTGGVRPIAQNLQPGQWPKAMIAVDLEQVTPVAISVPAVIGDVDPYGAVSATISVETAISNNGDGVEVRRAEPVKTFDLLLEGKSLEMEPPKPLEF